MVTITTLEESDRDPWQALFQAYLHFYGRDPGPALYDRAWREFRSGARMHALGARLGDELVGITHYFVHPSTSGRDVCYLQDLFTAPHARGQGVGRALIEAVAAWAAERDCSKVYWQTQEGNTTARRLYDAVANYSGFVVYDLPLSPRS
ncbi:GNAT family N-acetyltransferase [Intrasporangium sp.]|uniref:GNAT family N-acetyltransferase n=1 Tax=Intrasporangium sp. TaxID=1925024 RepID=UPI00293AEA3F|nr:GNAT family N-acetyltransferase [Intrasporangium sp.]MDV3220491.1 GNAT family N-acetyltransferase [Intrasporangium sp.]